MGYGLTYQLRFPVSSLNTRDNGKVIVCNIRDTTTLADNAEEYIYDMGYGNKLNYPESPILIQTVDNSKDKLKIVRGKQVTIQFFSRSNLDASIFSEGADDRWKVEIYVEGDGTLLGAGESLFTGFLVMADHEQEFQPNPNIVTLTATDNLALLKDVALTDFNNKNPKATPNKFKIIQFIAWALSKTNLKLNINVCCSIFEETLPGLCALDNVYIDPKTFEKEIGISEDCVTVIEKILKTFSCYLTQFKGMWWIQNIDELEGAIGGTFTFDYQGTLTSSQSPQLLRQDIGNGYDTIWLSEDAKINFNRPLKFVKYTFPYEFPKEIIDNIDFSRGGWLSFINLGDPYLKPFNCDDWVMVNNSRVVTSSSYIVRKYQDLGQTYEIERYLRVLPADSAASPWDYFKCDAIPIGLKDKASVSVDFRYEQDYTASAAAGRYIFTFFILGSDGNYYCYRQTTNDWHNVGTTIAGTNFGFLFQWDSDLVFEKDWQTVSVDLPAFPIDGDLFIGLYNGLTFDTTPQTLNYTNLRFDYSPYINGSYTKYSGQYRKVSQSGNYSGKIDDQIYLSDSPKQLFKGTMFKLNNVGAFVFTAGWYNGAVLPGFIAPDPQFIHPLGHIQVYNVWNQSNRSFRYFSGTVRGLKAGDISVQTQGINGSVPDLVEQYFLQDPNINTLNKRFMCTEINHDFDNDISSVTLMEVIDTAKGKVYSDPEEFKYITQ